MKKESEILANLIDKAQFIVFFGGAGVSTGSGIPDFRSATGLYNRENKTNYSPETMLSYDFMVEHPEEFYTYKRENLHYPDAKPNQAHLALARLETAKPTTTIITQNIDGLHQAAGSKNVLELHGSMRRFYCMKCHRDYPSELVWEVNTAPYCPQCQALVRPDVVLYGEVLNNKVIRLAESAVRRADLMIVGGSSLVVYPAAGLLNYFKGGSLVLINRDSTPYDDYASFVFHEDLSEILDQAIP